MHGLQPLTKYMPLRQEFSIKNEKKRNRSEPTGKPDINTVHTSHIPNPWPAKHPDQLARTPTIIRNGDHIGQRAVVLLYDLAENVDETVGCGATTEDDDFAFRGVRLEGEVHCWGWRIKFRVIALGDFQG